MIGHHAARIRGYLIFSVLFRCRFAHNLSNVMLIVEVEVFLLRQNSRKKKYEQKEKREFTHFSPLPFPQTARLRFR